MNDEPGEPTGRDQPVLPSSRDPWGNGSGEISLAGSQSRTNMVVGGGANQLSLLQKGHILGLQVQKINPAKEYGTVLLNEPLNEKGARFAKKLNAGGMSGLYGGNMGQKWGQKTQRALRRPVHGSFRRLKCRDHSWGI